MIKIGIDCRELREYKTGIGNVLHQFIIEAPKIDNNIEFVLFGNQYTNFNTINNYKKIIEPECITIFWDQIKLAKLLKQNKIDLFFSPYYKMPLLNDVKTIISMLDITYLMVEPYKNMLKNNLYIKNFIKIASTKAKKIFTSSFNSKKDLIEVLRLPEEKIEVIYLCIGDEFKPVPSDKIKTIKEKYKINKDYILYVGNFLPHKNIKRAIEAYEMLPTKIKDKYSFVLVGRGDVKIESTNIIFVKYVNDEDLPTLYSGADLFIFPSLYEGFGLPPIEAMACGTPVISSNTSSMPEILSDAAVYFNPYDVQDISKKMLYVLENDELKNNLKNKCLIRAKFFTPKNMTEKLINLFYSCIK